MDLVRKIVLAIAEPPHGPPEEFTWEGDREEPVGDHWPLLWQAGWINGSDISCEGHWSPPAMVNSWTWAGHEFAEASRHETLWNTAPQAVPEQAGSVGMGVLIESLPSLARSALGL